jgi:integrase
MTAWRQALADYLAVRRALGHKLERAGTLLAQFVSYLEATNTKCLDTSIALAWATQPVASSRTWWSHRLSIARGFAAHLHAVDPTHEVPPTDLLPSRPRRATPYLYSEEDIGRLIAACATLRTPHRVATYQTLIGLLATTGMRVGEAVALDRSDLERVPGLLTVRQGKFGKSRQLPLQPSTVRALAAYLSRGDRPRAAVGTPALLVSAAGSRLLYSNIQRTFRWLVHHASLQPRSDACRPKLHSLRHSFAVHTILDGYRDGGDPGTRLPLLATYLAHVDPGNTYYYLTAAPELLALVCRRLERQWGGEA